MASFTDKLPTFNPYVQQLPVEAMVEVGMEKQRRYDEGVQKIQTQIDNVAGLDIARDVDKVYLQSKLSQLGNNLKTVAAGDFSNYQLVNSVGGMVNQIGKDQNIQNAIISTRNYKKGREERDLYTKEGKGSPSNDWEFNDNVNRWLNGSIEDSFNSTYNPYTNYKKNAIEVIKALTQNKSISDDAFTVDSKGNLVISDAVIRTELAGISPDQIQQALLVGLSPADFKQMEIDGRYNYSNVDSESFVKGINDSYQDKVEFYTQQKKVLDNAKMSTQSNPEKAKLNSQIEQIDRTLRGITNEYQNISEMVSKGNVEGAKANLHTANFINGFSKAFSFTQTSQTVHDSPYIQAEFHREDKAQDWKKFVIQTEQSDRHFNATYDLQLQKLNLDKQVAADKAKGTGASSLYGGLPGATDKKDVPTFTLEKVISETEDTAREIESSDNRFMEVLGKDKQWLIQQKIAWQKSPTSVDPLIAQHFNTTEEKRRLMDSNMTMVMDIEKQVIAKHGDIYSKIPTNIPSLKIGDRTYSPRDVVDFNEKISKYIYWSGGGSTGGGGGAMLYNDNLAKKELSSKEYALYEIASKKSRGQKLQGSELAIMNMTDALRKSVNIPYTSTLQAIQKETAEEVTKRLTGSQGNIYGVNTGTAVEKAAIANVLTQFAKKAEDLEGGLANSPNFDVETARQLAIEPNTRYTFDVVEGTEVNPSMYEMTVSGAKGKSVQFKITPEEKIAVFGNLFEAKPEIQSIRTYQAQINKMGGTSTATSKGPTNVSNSYLKNIDFPGVNTYGVSGNIVTMDGGNTYSVRLNVYDPLTKKIHEDIPYPSKGVISPEQLNKALKDLNDMYIFQIVTGNESPTKEDINRVKEANKNPL